MKTHKTELAGLKFLANSVLQYDIFNHLQYLPNPTSISSVHTTTEYLATHYCMSN